MKEKELEFKNLCDEVRTSPKNIWRQKKNEVMDIWQQIIEQDARDISPEFLKWVQNTANNNEPSQNFARDLHRDITEPIKLWMDISKFAKIDTTEFTDLENMLASGITLNKIENAFKYNNTDLKEPYKKLVPNPHNLEFPKEEKELLNNMESNS